MKEGHREPPPGLSAEKIAPLLADTPYRVVSFLGRGGMGEVWVVEHDFLRRRFALKVLRPQLNGLADRLRVEAQAMGRLNHPNVVEVVDFWPTRNNRACVVMELLTGQNLWEHLHDHRALPVLEAITIARQALSALEAAHALGLVHRDIKPENLFLHEAAGYGRILKVLDFGIARVIPNVSPDTPAPPLIPTATGALVGSPVFMSPEAARGQRVDARADLFSVGLVLYIMIAGVLPRDIGAVEQAIDTRSDVPAGLGSVIQRAVRENPAERYQSASEFLAALGQFPPSVNPVPRFE